MKKVSMQMIADKVGVSTVTVHKALKGQHGVSEKMRNEIIQTAYDMGYQLPDKAILRHFVYLIHKDFVMRSDEGFYSEIYRLLGNECMKIGATLQTVVHDSAAATFAAIKAIASEHPIAGIFVSGQLSRDMLGDLQNLHLPVVCIDFYSSDYPYDYIYTDNYYAGYSLTKYLIRRGHTSIGFVGDISFSDAIADRYFGYLRALNKYKIAHDETLHIDVNIENAPFSFPTGAMPTAFVCHCDRAAATLYDRLAACGYRVPDDVSVIGFDNTALCEQLTPRLSSFGIEKINYATMALDAMTAQLEKREKVNYTKLNLRLYPRDSVRSLLSD